MPAGNRMHSSAALRTTDMWSSVIGNEFGKANDSSAVAGGGQTENAYEMNQNLMALARLSGASKGDAKRGSCKKCGEIGHLSFQCFNMLTGKKAQAGDVSSTSSDDSGEDARSVSTVSSTSSEGSSAPKRKRAKPSEGSAPSVYVKDKKIKKSKKDKKDKKKKEKKKEKKEKKEKKSKKDKKSGKEEGGGAIQYSKFLKGAYDSSGDSSDDDDAPRSAISGKKIKMKLEKDSTDKAQVPS